MAKMFKQLMKFSLVCTFGKHSERPLRKTVVLLCLSVASILTCGILAGRFLANMSLATDIPSKMLFCIISVLVFAVLGFIVLPTIQFFNSKQSSFNRNLMVLPLKRSTKWLVIMSPVFLISFLLTLFFVPVTISIAQHMKANLFLLFAGYLLGLLAAIGYSLLSFTRLKSVKYLGFVVYCVLQTYLLDKLLTTDSVYGNLLVFLINLGLFLCLLGFVQSYYTDSLTAPATNEMTWLSVPKQQLNSLWFGLKFMRNNKTLSSFTFCIILSLSVCFSYFVRHQSLSGGFVVVFGALLVCGLAADARSISRKNKTPEIVSLRGVNFFVNSEIRNLSIFSFLVVAPLLIVLIKTDGQVVWSLVFLAISIAVAAGMLGLMYGTLLVSEAGEIGTQFITGILSLASVVLVPKLFHFSDANYLIQAIAWLCVAGVCNLVILLTEQQRRNNYGYVK